jgi:hypothetical protein
VNRYQLNQHVAGLAVERGAPEPPKRSQAWAVGLAEKLWKSKSEAVEAAVDAYLDGKMTEARRSFSLFEGSPSPEDESQEVPASVGTTSREPGSDDQ